MLIMVITNKHNEQWNNRINFHTVIKDMQVNIGQYAAET
jgi:hypothetical protein